MANQKIKEVINAAEGKEGKFCFQVRTAKQIQDSVTTRKPFLVDGIISPGLTLLAAPIKKKKSFFALYLALCVAGKEDFMGRATRHGKVLYFALEDNEERMRDRMNTILDYDDAPAELIVSYNTEAAGNDFFGDLDRYLEESRGEIILVIIDVMQKIRSDKKSGQTEYAHDYAEIGRLKQIADKHGISLLAVTHTKKGKDAENRLNEISGGVGVTGVADTILMLRNKRKPSGDGAACGDGDKEKDERILSITGRDVPETEWAIFFNLENCKCEYMGTVAEERLRYEKKMYDSSPIVKTIKILLEKNGGQWSGTCTELLECGLRETGQALAKSVSALSRKVNKFDRLLEKDSVQHIRPDENGGHGGRNHFFQFVKEPGNVTEPDGEPPKDMPFAVRTEEAGTKEQAMPVGE